MAPEDKPRPAASPPQPPLSERLAAAIEDPSLRQPLSIRMTVRGGLPAKKYSFEFAASGDGAAVCRFEDRLKNREGESATANSRMTDKAFVALLTNLQPALTRPVEPPSFLPDTVIGILEISDGTSVRRIYFAADPEQARTQGKVPPPEVQQAVDAVYAAGASLTGVRNIKP